MTKSLEQVIKDNAPKGAEHIDQDGDYYCLTGIKNKPYAIWHPDDKEWVIYKASEFGLTRCLSDIEQIIALQNENAEKDKRIAELKEQNEFLSDALERANDFRYKGIS